MAQLRHVVEALERIAPARFAFAFDKVGLQVGDPDAEITRAVVSLDRSLAAVEHCVQQGAQMLVAHHPLLFDPVDSIVSSSHVGRTLLALAKAGIAFAAAHTNWDAAPGGISDALAAALDLRDVVSFGSASGTKSLKLVVFAPPDSVDSILDAASEAGAGRIGEYSRCAFHQAGTGTFRGSPATHPFVGRPGQIEAVDEVRIEMTLPVARAESVDRAVRRVHPYEEPALDFFTLRERAEQPIGRIGNLPAVMTLAEVIPYADEALKTRSIAWGDPAREIRRLAVAGGAGDFDWRAAQAIGADALLTGEVKQHVALEAVEEGFALIACGHYATEQPGCAALRDRLATELPEIEWRLFTPAPGFAGHPA